MPANLVVINGVLEYQVPDSWMAPLLSYLGVVLDKTHTKVQVIDPPAQAEAPEVTP